MMPKFFVDSELLKTGTIILNGETAHHMLHVLRLGSGDRVVLCDAHCMDFHCIINEIRPRDNILKLTVKQILPSLTESLVRVTLYQAFPKGDKMEFIIQKSVELGIQKIVPLLTKRVVLKPHNWAQKAVRYARISEAAAAQSMRGIIPEVTGLLTLDEALASSGETVQIMAYECEHKLTIKSYLSDKTPLSIGIWVGPEGGFDEEEVEILSKKASAVTLGPRILRTETAGMAALVQILCAMEA
jgi:16S rRNA (uracil1498-N3)-methyltransferase